MSNSFKQNSRFVVLSEKKEKQEVAKINNSRGKEERQFKEERPNKKNIFENEYEKQNKLKLKKEQELLNIDNFPQLITVTNKDKEKNIDNIPTFLEKIKTNVLKNQDKNEEQIEFEQLNPGWMVIKMDKETNKITMKEKKIIKNENPVYDLDVKHNVFEALATLYENRKNTYIDNWGEDEYDKMFICPNYDYYYFDKLDEKYEKEMSKYNNDYDVYNE